MNEPGDWETWICARFSIFWADMHFFVFADDVGSDRYPSNPINEQNMGRGEIDGWVSWALEIKAETITILHVKRQEVDSLAAF